MDRIAGALTEAAVRGCGHRVLAGPRSAQDQQDSVVGVGSTEERAQNMVRVGQERGVGMIRQRCRGRDAETHQDRRSSRACHTCHQDERRRHHLNTERANPHPTTCIPTPTPCPLPLLPLPSSLPASTQKVRPQLDAPQSTDPRHCARASPQRARQHPPYIFRELPTTLSRAPQHNTTSSRAMAGEAA